MAFPYSASASASNAEEAMHARSSVRANLNHTEALGSASLLSGSAVSWSAIAVGAAAASALSLILLILGTGLGLSSVSPWASAGMGAATLGVSAIVWLTATQLVASGMGGYLAGRLRTKYVAVHNDEVYFRDTAHGFLAWALATLLMASVFAAAAGSIVGVGASMSGGVVTAAAGAAATATASSDAKLGTDTTNPMGYLMDSLFRKSDSGTPSAAGPAVEGSSAASTAEVARIFITSAGQTALPPEDAKYIAAAVALRTGLSPDEAQARVKTSFERMQTKLREAEANTKQAADTARKATAYAALWLFVSLLIGAFCASWGATLGGRHRDI
jgi:hypothetical protein